MGHALRDRRHSSRFEAQLLRHLRATLRPGNVVSLVNLGSGGALVRSPRPLRPGIRIHMQIRGSSRTVRVIGQVLRCGVASLSACDGVTYVGALKFDGAFDVPWGDM
jgi:hypothetical protein